MANNVYATSNHQKREYIENVPTVLRIFAAFSAPDLVFEDELAFPDIRTEAFRVGPV